MNQHSVILADTVKLRREQGSRVYNVSLATLDS